MHIDLTGKQAVVGGSTGGIGRHHRRGAGAGGARGGDHGRGEQRVARALSEMRGGIPGAELEGVAVLVGRAPTADILVNNVGTAVPKPFDGARGRRLADLFQLNVMSGSTSLALSAAMVKKGWGRVVFNQQRVGGEYSKEMINYGMTKTAQLAISRGVARASPVLASRSIRSCRVRPDPRASAVSWVRRPRGRE